MTQYEYIIANSKYGDISYQQYINNNIFSILTKTKNKNLLFKYKLYDEFECIDLQEYSTKQDANFTLLQFGKFRIKIFIKNKDAPNSTEDSFFTNTINYDEVTSCNYLTSQDKVNYKQALSQISRMLKEKNEHSDAIAKVLQKLQAISAFEHGIIKYFQEQGVNQISLYGNKHDVELSKFVYINARHSKNFNIKYYLAKHKFRYKIFIPRQTSITHKNSKKISFAENDIILVCTLNKNNKQLKALAKETKAKVIHLQDILSNIYVLKFVIEPLLQIKNNNPRVNLIVLLTPQARYINNKSRNEELVVVKTGDHIRKDLNKEEPIIPPALKRFGNSIEYNREI